MNAVAKELMIYMSDLSEEAYYAGWMLNLEYDLWQAVVDGPRSYGHMIIDEKHIAKLKDLSNRCGGWIVFGEPTDNVTEETFVPMQQWLQMYQQRTKSE